ncbi:Extracellular ligand-binding receptor [Paraburkholderia ribeironis]|uniref:Extracellular ligand-binding receptor n=1 Tax=Paraburkholderia ribeironis TaxID=1247936 RepID=A0A1N7RZS6_9BURK|nr:ABC transporter substrate-binding protein [Paraburkholderia ribeironis]SIT40573.1 Extracellular ligand-binding receptor [Paraburkholderia ribeironis]
MKLKLAIIAASLALTSMHSGAAERIKIGAVLSTTGAASFLGDPEYKTLKMYVDSINAEGGLLGRQLELVSYDDGSDANQANTLTRRLLFDDKVDVVIGGTSTGATMSMDPLIERAQVPFVSLGGAVVIIEPVKKWMFKTSHTDRMAAERIFDDMKKHGISKIGLLSETSGLGQSGKKESELAAPRYGIQIVSNETYNPKDTDMSPQLTKMKNNPDVQAVLVFGMGQGPAVATRNRKQLGLKVPLYQTHGVCSDEYIRLSGDAAEGVRLPCAAILVGAKLPDNDPQKPVVTGYAKAYAAKWHSEVSAFGGGAYDALMIYKAAVERAGTTDKAKVRDAMEHTKGVIGTAGIFNMTPENHLGLGLESLRMLEIRNGDWTLVH